MAYIKLNNFRRFENLDCVRYKSINFLVGKNNAGKSTLVKALMLVWDNLKNIHWDNMNREIGMNTLLKMPTPMFHFDADTFCNLHIGTFKRAKTDYKNEPSIVFEVSAGENLAIELAVTGDVEKDTVSAPIEKIKISTTFNGTIELNFFTQTMAYTPIDYNKLGNEEHHPLEKVADEESIEDLEKRRDQLIAEGDLVGVVELNERITKLTSQKKKEQKKPIVNTDAIEFPLSYFHNSINENILAQYIRTFELLSNTTVIDTLYKEKKIKKVEYKVEKAKRDTLKSHIADFRTIAAELEKTLAAVDIQYMHAHAATQKLILTLDESSKDINSTIVHEYFKSSIIANSKPDKFLSKWLGNEGGFGIGDSISIEQFSGEGYIVKVESETEVQASGVTEKVRRSTNLSDMGMGSIQLIILLMKLVTIANNNERYGRKPIIIIEEPEQNLHPKLQSKLAEMFYDFNKSFGNTIIAETHSEYLIRKTQVIVSEIGKNVDEEDFSISNPFNVIYFTDDSVKQPYEMEYQQSGRFINSFGEGFYDAAGSLAFDLSKNEIQSKPTEEFNWGNLIK